MEPGFRPDRHPGQSHERRAGQVRRLRERRGSRRRRVDSAELNRTSRRRLDRTPPRAPEAFRYAREETRSVRAPRTRVRYSPVQIRVALRRQVSSTGQQPVFVALPCMARGSFRAVPNPCARRSSDGTRPRGFSENSSRADLRGERETKRASLALPKRRGRRLVAPRRVPTASRALPVADAPGLFSRVSERLGRSRRGDQPRRSLDESALPRPVSIPVLVNELFGLGAER